ncbi:MAG: DUF309 domain-containing protein [Candidatus Binataceae bacterium]
MSKNPQADPWSAGIALFNDRRFFECHEIWEEVWKASRGPERLFCQGMIQAAAAMVHAGRGRKTGALSLWRKARAKLELFAAEYQGIAVTDFVTDCDEYFAAVFGEKPRGGAIPKIRRLE